MSRGVLIKTAAAVVAVAFVIGAVAVGVRTAGPSGASALSHPHAVASTTQTSHRKHGVRLRESDGDAVLPVSLDPTPFAAVVACLLGLSAWAVWQTRHRCATCGYCPIWCRCDDVTHEHGNRRDTRGVR
jgi:hypothetical protein